MSSYKPFYKYNKNKPKPKKENIRYKEKIIINDLVNFLNNLNINEQNILINKKISAGSSTYRPDLLITLTNLNIIIEIDERQHSIYNKIKEKNRIEEIFKDLNNKSLIVIRLNPDKYINIDGVKKKSIFCKDKLTKIYKIRYINQYNIRLNKVKFIINYYLNIINIDNIIYNYHLFFDGYDDNDKNLK